MDSERAYYFAAFLRMVLPLAPIGLMLILTIFLRQKQRTRLTFWLQATAALWLLIAIGNRYMLAWAMGVFGVGDNNNVTRLDVFSRISEFTWNAETFVFIAFAILLLIHFRRGAAVFEATGR